MLRRLWFFVVGRGGGESGMCGRVGVWFGWWFGRLGGGRLVCAVVWIIVVLVVRFVVIRHECHLASSHE